LFAPVLSFALIIPSVSVNCNPNGFPIAIAFSPIFTSSESPRSTLLKFPSIFSSAMSSSWSIPISWTWWDFVSYVKTPATSAPSTTWLFVTMYPSSVNMNPVPWDMSVLIVTTPLFSASNTSEKSAEAEAFTSPSSSLKSVWISDRSVTDVVIVLIFAWRSWLFRFIFSLRYISVSFRTASVLWILVSTRSSMKIWEAMKIRKAVGMIMCFAFILLRFFATIF